VSQDIESDLARRQKKTARLVQSLLILTLLLVAIAFIAKDRFGHTSTSRVDIPVKIIIVVFGLGAVALRRTRFSARIEDDERKNSMPNLTTSASNPIIARVTGHMCP